MCSASKEVAPGSKRTPKRAIRRGGSLVVVSYRATPLSAYCLFFFRLGNAAYLLCFFSKAQQHKIGIRKTSANKTPSQQERWTASRTSNSHILSRGFIIANTGTWNRFLRANSTIAMCLSKLNQTRKKQNVKSALTWTHPYAATARFFIGPSFFFLLRTKAKALLYVHIAASLTGKDVADSWFYFRQFFHSHGNNMAYWIYGAFELEVLKLI